MAKKKKKKGKGIRIPGSGFTDGKQKYAAFKIRAKNRKTFLRYIKKVK